eukprot:6491859-Amphidinium_carterae.1
MDLYLEEFGDQTAEVLAEDVEVTKKTAKLANKCELCNAEPSVSISVTSVSGMLQLALDGARRCATNLGNLGLHRCATKAESWARITKGGKPIGEKCRACVSFCGDAFPLLEWQAIVMSYKSSQDFKQGLDEARQVWLGAKKPGFFRSHITHMNNRGIRWEQKATFLNEHHFKEKYGGVNFKEAGLTPTKVVLPSGETSTGIFVPSTEPPECYLVSEGALQEQEVIFDGGKQVRANQGHELANWFVENSDYRESAIPTACPKLYKVEETARKALEQQTQEGAATAAEPEESEDEEVDQVENTAASLFQVHRDRVGNTKGRGKGRKGKGKGTAKSSPKRRLVGKAPASTAGVKAGMVNVQGTASSASSGGHDAAVDDHSRQGAVTASAAPSRMGPASIATQATGKGLDEKMCKYRAQLEPLHVMSGTLEASGRVLWQSSQTLASLKKKDSSSHTCLSLHALVEEAKEAQKLCRGKVETLSTSARKEVVKRFQYTKFPPGVQYQLVSLEAKDCALPGSVNEFLEILFPLVREGEPDGEYAFNGSAPRLCEATISESSRSNCLQTSFTDGLIRLIQQGMQDKDATISCLESMIDTLNGVTSDGLLDAALNEVKVMVRCVLALAHPITGHMGSSIEDVDGVWGARAESNRFLVKQVGIDLHTSVFVPAKVNHF